MNYFAKKIPLYRRILMAMGLEYVVLIDHDGEVYLRRKHQDLLGRPFAFYFEAIRVAVRLEEDGSTVGYPWCKRWLPYPVPEKSLASLQKVVSL